MTRRLARPRDDRWIAGVCSGLARRFGLSSGMVRLLFVLSCLLPLGALGTTPQCSNA